VKLSTVLRGWTIRLQKRTIFDTLGSCQNNITMKVRHRVESYTNHTRNVIENRSNTSTTKYDSGRNQPEATLRTFPSMIPIQSKNLQQLKPEAYFIRHTTAPRSHSYRWRLYPTPRSSMQIPTLAPGERTDFMAVPPVPPYPSIGV